jgi:hypothetical protein
MCRIETYQLPFFAHVQNRDLSAAFLCAVQTGNLSVVFLCACAEKKCSASILALHMLRKEKINFTPLCMYVHSTGRSQQVSAFIGCRLKYAGNAEQGKNLKS